MRRKAGSSGFVEYLIVKWYVPSDPNISIVPATIRWVSAGAFNRVGNLGCARTGDCARAFDVRRQTAMANAGIREKCFIAAPPARIAAPKSSLQISGTRLQGRERAAVPQVAYRDCAGNPDIFRGTSPLLFVRRHPHRSRACHNTAP